jgi:ElaB/YqjD/DUF883 family membrane-anchored ribosome-binding protein
MINSGDRIMTAKTHSTIPASKDKLMEDLQLVIADAEELLRATAAQAGEGATAARVLMQKNLHVIKERLGDAEMAVIDRTQEAAKLTDEYVHENPWHAIGISACVGAIVGMLVARR